MKRLSFLVLFLSLTLNAYAAQGIVIKAVAGEAVVTAADGSQAQAKVGDEIPEGGTLASDFQGTVDVSIHGNSGFRFLPDSKVTFESADSKKTKLRLENGNLIARFKNQIDPDSTFEVETPTAVMAVRGTQFWGRVVSPGEKPVSSFAVREGVVDITAKSNGKVYTLKKGDAIDLPEDLSQISLREAAEGELAAIATSETIEI